MYLISLMAIIINPVRHFHEKSTPTCYFTHFGSSSNSRSRLRVPRSSWSEDSGDEDVEELFRSHTEGRSFNSGLMEYWEYGWEDLDNMESGVLERFSYTPSLSHIYPDFKNLWKLI